MSYERYLSNYLCGECHIGFLKEHPELALAKDGYFKCYHCGFSKKIIPKLVNEEWNKNKQKK